jgi:hypothetical protein
LSGLTFCETQSRRTQVTLADAAHTTSPAARGAHAPFANLFFPSRPCPSSASSSPALLWQICRCYCKPPPTPAAPTPAAPSAEQQQHRQQSNSNTTLGGHITRPR